MRIVYTLQFADSLEYLLTFLKPNISSHQLQKIHDNILSTIDLLETNPYLGQLEPYLTHLNLEHRRLVVKHCKIIYRIENNTIYITEVFDTRQELSKMKG